MKNINTIAKIQDMHNRLYNTLYSVIPDGIYVNALIKTSLEVKIIELFYLFILFLCLNHNHF